MRRGSGDFSGGSAFAFASVSGFQQDLHLEQHLDLNLHLDLYLHLHLDLSGSRLDQDLYLILSASALGAASGSGGSPGCGDLRIELMTPV